MVKPHPAVESRRLGSTTRTSPTSERRRDATVASVLVEQLATWGVDQAYGVSGEAIAPVAEALAGSSIAVRHCRHETGAAFAACEGHFASRRPTVVFATSGPGLLNALTGITAAKWEGAKLILVSGHSDTAAHGRRATDETTSCHLPKGALYATSSLFDFAIHLEMTSELPEVCQRLMAGLQQPGGFVAHVGLPVSIQQSRVVGGLTVPPRQRSLPAVGDREIAEIAAQLRRESFAIWAGFGATAAAAQVRRLAERTGARVFCSPRAKGVVDECDEHYLGVTGLGGHDAVVHSMIHDKPRRLLVLGSRLGEATSLWDRDLLPSEGLIHVDIDPDVPGTAFPDFPTFAVHAEIGCFLDGLLQHLSTPPRQHRRRLPALPFDEPPPIGLAGRRPVRPRWLMEAIQRRIIDRTDAVVMSEAGHAFAWCNHYLRFAEPGRYRVSSLFGSMGHTAAGVVGAALARDGKAVAVVGDGAILTSSEISSAVRYDAQAVWIVLNDADGHPPGVEIDASPRDDAELPRVDFAAWAHSVGAEGIAVDREDALDAVLDRAMSARGPVVVDVQVDATESSPLLRRFESLTRRDSSSVTAADSPA